MMNFERLMLSGLAMSAMQFVAVESRALAEISLTASTENRLFPNETYFLEIVATKHVGDDGSERDLICPYFGRKPAPSHEANDIVDEVEKSPVDTLKMRWKAIAASALNSKAPYAVDRQIFMSNLTAREKWLASLRTPDDIKAWQKVGLFFAAPVSLGAWGASLGTLRIIYLFGAGVMGEVLIFNSLEPYTERVTDLIPASHSEVSFAELTGVPREVDLVEAPHEVPSSALLEMKAMLGLNGIDEALSYVRGPGRKIPFILVDPNFPNLPRGKIIANEDKYMRCASAQDIAAAMQSL